MSLSNTAETLLPENQSPDVLRKFRLAIKRVAHEHGNNGEAALTEEELVEMIRAWEPQRDIICLYVRWARQLRRNFNLDSIATLLCLSRQCGYTPINFLKKVKTLYVQRNHKSVFGVTFHFEIPNRQDIDRDRLNKEFLGLSVTLSLLQEQVTSTAGILGKTGMRQTKPRTAYAMGIPIESDIGSQKTTVVGHPTIEFHTKNGLLNRIWKSINHRWLALFLTEHIFRQTIGPSWSYQNALVFSFQMMAPCGPCRYDFLAPLVGYCLKFPTQESISLNGDRLQSIWNDPSKFANYGNSILCQFSAEEKAREIAASFEDLQCEIPVKSKKISYNRDCPWQRRWSMLRAYIFHFWLDSTNNGDVKVSVTKRLTTVHPKRRKRKFHAVDLSLRKQPQQPVPFQADESLKAANQAPDLASPCSGTTDFRSITSSRRRLQKDPPPNKAVEVTVLAPTPAPDMDIQSFPNIDWTDLRLIARRDLDCKVRSYLLIHRPDGIDILSMLSPFEVYSADHLRDRMHCRVSGCSTYYPIEMIGPVVLNIGSDADCFIDRVSKSYHVAREPSTIFQQHLPKLPSMESIRILCEAIVCHGVVDTKRAPGQYRVNIGNGGQNWQNGAPCKLHGLEFQKGLEKNENVNASQVIRTIGRITEFTWNVMCSLQSEAGDHPIAPDVYRKRLYASHLNEYLGMDDKVGFEDLTLVVSVLHPEKHNVQPHKDTMNDSLAGYTRTSAFNMVMICGNDETPIIIHFQLICNFRKVIGQYVIPFHRYLTAVTGHARQYIAKWHKSMEDIFVGKTADIPTVSARWLFFLDDSLKYETVTISHEEKHKQSLKGDYILSEVGTSRTLSFSMFINAITKLQPYLKFDQTIELAFACSYLSNPFWFDWTMSTIIKRLEDSHDAYELGLHPFYDWTETTMHIFGSWQGGPYNRWSPCGGKETVLQLFGADPNSTPTDRIQGEIRLSGVVSILFSHVKWINTLSETANDSDVGVPMTILEAQYNTVVREIGNIVSCQFGHFRLGVMTTILSGCGLLKEGKHLRSLMYPVKGTASYKHLSHPDADYMSNQRARALVSNEENVSVSNDGNGFVAEQHHDVFMMYLSGELGFSDYCRDEIECILCESHPMRNLNSRDCFRKGMSLFDCNEKGEFFRRDYGRGTTWIKLQAPEQYELAYVDVPSILYIAFDSQLSFYAGNLGNELRSSSTSPVRFKGRNSKTSAHQRVYSNNHYGNDSFYHPSMKMADFYVGSVAERLNINSMFVLSDAECAVETACCNDLEVYDFGDDLYRHLLKMPTSNIPSAGMPVAAASYHMDLELTNDEVTFFHGHLDKPFVERAWFVPIGVSSFYTMLAVNREWGKQQDQSSLSSFNEWKATLSSREVKKIDDFFDIFETQAKKLTGKTTMDTLLYFNKPGSILSFPANQCYHATIIPKKPLGYPRDLMIFHTLDGTNS